MKNQKQKQIDSAIIALLMGGGLLAFAMWQAWTLEDGGIKQAYVIVMIVGLLTTFISLITLSEIKK